MSCIIYYIGGPKDLTKEAKRSPPTSSIVVREARNNALSVYFEPAVDLEFKESHVSIIDHEYRVMQAPMRPSETPVYIAYYDGIQ